MLDRFEAERGRTWDDWSGLAHTICPVMAKCPGDAMTLLGILFFFFFYIKENFYNLVTPSFRHPELNLRSE